MRKGWGYFDLPICVYFKKETGLKPFKIEHLLEFEEPGSWKNFKFQLPKRTATNMQPFKDKLKLPKINKKK